MWHLVRAVESFLGDFREVRFTFMHAQTIVVRDDKKGDPHEVDVLADYPVAAKMDSCLEKTMKST